VEERKEREKITDVGKFLSQRKTVARRLFPSSPSIRSFPPPSSTLTILLTNGWRRMKTDGYFSVKGPTSKKLRYEWWALDEKVPLPRPSVYPVTPLLRLETTSL
jgi:hypothetical protein